MTRFVFDSKHPVRKFARCNLTCPVVAGTQLFDSPRVDVKTDHRHTGSRERHRHRQADITKSNHRDLTSVAHTVNPCPFRDLRGTAPV